MRRTILLPVLVTFLIAACGADLELARKARVGSSKVPKAQLGHRDCKVHPAHRVRLVHKALLGRPEIPLMFGLSCALTSQ